jgi:P4 family phage/plasmid primase-like protien
VLTHPDTNGTAVLRLPAEPQDRQAEVDEIHAEVIKQYEENKLNRFKGKTNNHTTNRSDADKPPDDDQKIIRRLCNEKGGKGKALWAGSVGGYPSQSEADAALCCKLAWLVGPDPDRIDRLFRQSGLMRDKWEQREDYRTRTIKSALAKVTKYCDWSRGGQWQASQAGSDDGDDPGCEEPDQDEPPTAPASSNSSSVGDLNPIHLTDVGNARRVLKDHGANLHYCKPWKSFVCWDGTRWAVDETDEPARMVKRTQAKLFKWAADQIEIIAKVDDDEDRNAKLKNLTALLHHCLKWERDRAITACLNQMKSEAGIPVTPARLDADPWLLSVANGTIELRTGRFREHRREDLITKLAPVRYDPAATCPLWVKCLDKWMDGSANLTRYLQTLVGHCLSGDVSEQALWFLYGSGANGKSTFILTLLAMLGDYACQAVSELLLQKSSEAHPTERADLLGRRFVATIETDEGKRLAEALTKQLTGGDKLKARRMRQDFFEMAPTWKLFLVANHKPTVRGQDLAMWRRIKLIPFLVTITDAEKDKTLGEKLKAELPGILNWALAGCQRWQQEGLVEPEEVKAATAAYQAEQDLVAGFIAECCILNPEVRSQAAKVHEAYADWSGDRMTSPKMFGKRLEAKGFQRKQINGRAWWFGIGLPAPDVTKGPATGANSDEF